MDQIGVAGETETKGQIKLRFKTAAGKDVVCIRSFQLTQKASKMEYKAIESVLQTINPHTGEKVCLSYRCADMDREIPALMGVSKAILENVIFVHQDEANWPLQDPSTLKKKFDDIFSATRYTKALEVIKKLHKEQAQEIKIYKLKLENLQTLKDAAYKLREGISQDQEKTEVLQGQLQDLERNIQTMDAKIQHNEATLKDLRKLEKQKMSKTDVRSTLYKVKEEQHANLAEENEDTDEELKEWKTKFDERIAMLESKSSKLEREKDDLAARSSLLNIAIKESIKEISKLQTEAEAHVSLKNERDSLIQKLFARHNLGSLPSTPFSNEVAMNFSNRIKSRFMDLEKDLEEKKKSNELKLKVAWDRFMNANNHWKDTEAQKQAKVEIKKGILKRIEEKERERDSYELHVSNMNLAHIDERDKNMQNEIERKTNQLAGREFESNILQKQNELFTIEQKIKALSREKDIMDADSEDRVLLSFKKMDEIRDRVKGVLKGRLPPDKDLKNEIGKALRALGMEFDDLNSKSRESEKEVNMLQMKIQEVNNNLTKLHKDVDSRKRFIESRVQSLDPQAIIDSYLQVLDLAKEKRDMQKSKYNIADGMRQMFDPFERVARAHHICPCCERPFSAEEEDDFVKKQRVKATSSAEHIKVLAVESSNADSSFQQLDKLRVVYEEYAKIGSETIPLAEKKLIELKEELDQKSMALDDVIINSGLSSSFSLLTFNLPLLLDGLFWVNTVTYLKTSYSCCKRLCYPLENLIEVFDSCGSLAFKLVIACLANTASPSSSFYYIFFHILLSRTIGAAAKFTSAVLLHLFLAVHNAFRRFREFRESSYLQVLGVLAQIKADKDSVEALVPPVENVDRLYQEIQALQKQVDDLEYKLDFRGQGVKSKEEIQLELNTLQSTKDSLHNDLEKLRDERRDMENDLSNIRLRWHRLREDKVEAAKQLSNVKMAEDELDRLSEEKSQVDLDEKHLAEALGPLSNEKEKWLGDYNDLKGKLNSDYEEQAEVRRNYQQGVETLLGLTSKIKEYAIWSLGVIYVVLLSVILIINLLSTRYYDSRKGDRLKELQEKQTLSESELGSCEIRKQEIVAELDRSKELIQKQVEVKRNIEDNLKYRKTRDETDELTREIESLEEKMMKIGGVSTIEADLVKLTQERERLLSELNRCKGTMSVYQSNVSKNKVELKQAQYKDIDKRYYDQLIQLKTTEMANKDLDRYYNALDKALMRFHTMKMEEINKIIRELWQQTYRGQDIDYIFIHSDSEGAGTRSYSYRVLMQTGNAELEMRGRCSAGQKVLASLIIRLALAETFCLNCGILALDEPTTNLDGPNAESLAAALLRIMEDRKGQENFQLIVITHDERFAQLIGQRQHAERYYRVTKDDHQHSIIEAQEIFE
ncbi:hypothetical protein RHSIM_Rhsim02G0061900 [Rhododendron simsii]|uniref:Zinc-hook domain-containing protein n=1 Tax=Rhododendron simsii TaxID=118357 RepID=A0A834HE25_RHOSS|nr:hypothetical protein RHSIM_Rhsim02G0061900 [Rhododendron simsii]